MGVLNGAQRVIDLPVPTGRAVLGILPALHAAINGTGSPVRLVPPDGSVAPLVAGDAPAGTALLVRTSGSSGEPRSVVLTASALRHAAAAGERALGTDGSWLLALPGERIAGVMVLVRALLAGRQPVVLDTSQPFTVERFALATAAVVGPHPSVSLVPTQLHRAMRDPAGRDALRRFGSVLVGGAALAPSLAQQCREADVRIVESYAMTETCGGCVFDGQPLDGVDVRAERAGRLVLSGDPVASGSWGEPYGHPFRVVEGRRTFITSDLGVVQNGRVRILGRIDDVLISGGVNVVPQQVEALLVGAGGVEDIGVTGVPDAEWGTAVTAVVVPRGAGPDLADLRRLARHLSAAAAPQHLVLVDALPVLPSGKLDRSALAAAARAALGRR